MGEEQEVYENQDAIRKHHHASISNKPRPVVRPPCPGEEEEEIYENEYPGEKINPGVVTRPASAYQKVNIDERGMIHHAQLPNERLAGRGSGKDISTVEVRPRRPTTSVTEKENIEMQNFKEQVKRGQQFAAVATGSEESPNDERGSRVLIASCLAVLLSLVVLIVVILLVFGIIKNDATCQCMDEINRLKMRVKMLETKNSTQPVHITPSSSFHSSKQAKSTLFSSSPVTSLQSKPTTSRLSTSISSSSTTESSSTSSAFFVTISLNTTVP
eukprot:gene15973-17581_t